MLDPYEFYPPDAVWIYRPGAHSGILKVKRWCDGCFKTIDQRRRVLLVGTEGRPDNPALTLCYSCAADWQARNAPAEFGCGCPGCAA